MLYRISLEEGKAVVIPGERETAVDLAVSIARLAMETAPAHPAAAIFNKSSRQEPLNVPEQEVEALRLAAKRGHIGIDYWRNRRIKLNLTISDGSIAIWLPYWADRWAEHNDSSVPDYAIDSIKAILDRVEQENALEFLKGLRPVSGTDPDFDYKKGVPKS